MSKISEKLNVINDAKNNIKIAIETDGIEVGNVGIQEYVDKINIINTNIANAYTEIENKGVIPTGTKNSKNLASSISSIQTGGTGGGDEEIATSFISTIDNTLGANVTKLPEGITSIGNMAFNGRTNLALTSLPNGITAIGNSSFNGCSKLALTRLPDTVKTIGTNAFYNCTNLALEKLPEDLQTVGSMAFYYCANVKFTTLPSKMTKMPSFSYATGLKNFEVPEGVTSAETNALANCLNLETLKIPSTLKTISENFCNNCKKLHTVEIAEGVTKIDVRAFFTCTVLRSLVIPSTITNIETQAFASSTSLKAIICKGTTPPKLSTNVFNNVNGYYVYVPDESVDAYKAATNWASIASAIKPISELPDEFKELL